MVSGVKFPVKRFAQKGSGVFCDECGIPMSPAADADGIGFADKIFQRDDLHFAIPGNIVPLRMNDLKLSPGIYPHDPDMRKTFVHGVFIAEKI